MIVCRSPVPSRRLFVDEFIATGQENGNGEAARVYSSTRKPFGSKEHSGEAVLRTRGRSQAAVGEDNATPSKPPPHLERPGSGLPILHLLHHDGRERLLQHVRELDVRVHSALLELDVHHRGRRSVEARASGEPSPRSPQSPERRRPRVFPHRHRRWGADTGVCERERGGTVGGGGTESGRRAPEPTDRSHRSRANRRVRVRGGARVQLPCPCARR